MPSSFMCRPLNSIRAASGSRHRHRALVLPRLYRHRHGLLPHPVSIRHSPRYNTVQASQPPSIENPHSRQIQNQSRSPTPTTSISSESPETGLRDAAVKQLGTKLATIFCGALRPWKCPDITYRDGEELVCSYNWVIDEGQRHRPLRRINVPGELPVHCPGQTSLPIQVNPDPRQQIRPEGLPENGQISSVPYEAVFLATQVMNPGFRFDEIDILIDAGSLNFLRRLCNQHGPSPTSLNRLENELGIHREFFTIHDTLVISNSSRTIGRMYPSVLSRTRGLPFFYGKSFEKAFTTCTSQDRDDATTEVHWRVIRYRLGDLNCAVLFEVDASWRNPEEMAAAPRDARSLPRDTGTHLPILYSLSGDVPFFHQGTGAEQANLVELKSKYSRLLEQSLGQNDRDRSKLDFDFVFTGRTQWDIPSFWFGRIPILAIGYHHNGRFQKVQHFLAGPELLRWERLPKFRFGFRRLVALMHQMRDLARTGGKTYIAAYRMNRDLDCLEIHENNELVKPPIPQHIVERFWTASRTDEPKLQDANVVKAEDRKQHDPSQPNSQGKSGGDTGKTCNPGPRNLVRRVKLKEPLQGDANPILRTDDSKLQAVKVVEPDREDNGPSTKSSQRQSGPVAQDEGGNRRNQGRRGRIEFLYRLNHRRK